MQRNGDVVTDGDAKRVADAVPVAEPYVDAIRLSKPDRNAVSVRDSELNCDGDAKFISVLVASCNAQRLDDWVSHGNVQRIADTVHVAEPHVDSVRLSQPISDSFSNRDVDLHCVNNPERDTVAISSCNAQQLGDWVSHRHTERVTDAFADTESLIDGFRLSEPVADAL